MPLSSMADTIYALRFITLFNMRFTQWRAYRHGIIDREGNKIKDPESPNEKRAWTKLHVVIANIKKAFYMLPGGQSIIASLAATLATLRESNGDYGYILNDINSNLYGMINEAVVAGTGTGSGGTGETTGAFVKPGLNRLFQHAGSRNPMSYIEWLKRQKQISECAESVSDLRDPGDIALAANQLAEIFADEDELEEFVSAM